MATPLAGPLAQAVLQAQAALQAGQGPAALALARSLAAAAPRHPDLQHLLAMSLAQCGQLHEAEQAFRDTLALSPGQPMVLMNLARLYRTAGKPQAALEALRAATAAATAPAPAWRALASAALEAGAAGEAQAAARKAAALAPADAGAWQLLGAALRATGHHADAVVALDRAVQLAPSDAGLWMNLGAAQRLSGRPDLALASYRQAELRGWRGPELDHARIGALVDLGRSDEALSQARVLVQAQPTFPDAHTTLANLVWELGGAPGEDPIDTFRRAAHAHPGHRPLQVALVRFLLESRQAQEAADRLVALRAAQDDVTLVMLEAHARELLRQSTAARALYEAADRLLGASPPAAFLNAFTRHLLRTGDWPAAGRRAQQAVQASPQDQEAWAYLGTTWRLLGDARADWLCDTERLVGYVEVEPPAGWRDMPTFLGELRQALDALHQARREPVVQSLRGGSQTPGMLFGRTEPRIQAAARALLASAERWAGTLPFDDTHPFLSRLAPALSYCGSWSVKLWSEGRHVNHVHSQGWASSAFYVSLPDAVVSGAQADAGCLQFGQPPLELGLDLPPQRIVRPRVGHLALFPSYLWHGTVPFVDHAPRVTVAFDLLPRAPLA